MAFEYKYPHPRGYFITRHGTFQVRFTRNGIPQHSKTFKTEDEARNHFLQITSDQPISKSGRKPKHYGKKRN
jgi:hypothetical protein